jgi:putative ABC transport system substrate-binding protein
MRRRDFVGLLGGAAAWPLAARAQQQAVPVIGFSNSGSAWSYAQQTASFQRGLNETGYVEHRNVGIEYRWAEGHYERLPILAAELVRRQVAVIVAGGSLAAQAAKAATATIPIVFSTAFDPVALGFVENLARPGGNLTGATDLNVEVAPKRLELMHEANPAATIMAALLNPTNPASEPSARELQAAARTLGIELHILHASAERDLDAAFATLIQLRAGGLVIGADPFINNNIEQIAALALRHAVPAIYSRDFVLAGGLMSYGGALSDSYHLAGIYAGRILKGEKPADLPVQQTTKVELTINLKTAKALGLTFPLTLLGRADEVIE